MVVKMMKWRPWPPLSSDKFEVKIVVQQLKGLDFMLDDGIDIEEYGKLAIKLKWIGSKGNSLSLNSFRKHVRKNFTKDGSFSEEDGVVDWNEEFVNVCNFVTCKEGSFYPWEITFKVFNGSKRGQNDKVAVLFAGSLNLVNLVLKGQQKDIEVNVPLKTSKSNNGIKPTLCLSISLLELRSTQEPMDITQEPVARPLRTLSKKVVPTEKTNDVSSRKVAKNGKGRFLRAISSRKAKKDCRDEDINKTEDPVYIVPDDLHDKKSLSYETLSRSNYAGQVVYSSTSSSEDEDLVYYGKTESEEGCNLEKSPTSVIKQSSIHGPISSILPWRKRKLSFKPFKEKGEPLLRKGYKDDGGDDIDYDRRLFSSSSEEESTFTVLNRTSVSEFGDDSFTVGSWEQKDIINRDGNMTLKTSVFFASIDQMSEKADGESACTSLATGIAEWFQSNTNQMPIKSQFDSLIQTGSSEWRHLCENETHISRFPDKHFDLDTVLESKPRVITVAPEKSFVGFFHPEGNEHTGFEFLQGAMSFDNIWEEISQSVSDHPMIYIVSWNDHFFVLKVEHDAYYIIDTLGERLFRGCNQAYILKFDQETTLYTPKPDTDDSSTNEEQETTVLYKGKEACKEYIKNFLAAIPIRQLQTDIKKGSTDSTILHQRLQIEFHYTQAIRE